MRIAWTVFGMAAAVAFGQTSAPANVERVFHLTEKETPEDMQEIVTSIRAVAGIQQITTDNSQRILTIEGATAQMAVAEWLIHEMDAPVPASGPQEFLPPGSSDVVRVYFTHAATPQGLQEIVTSIRSVADVPRLFTYRALNAAVMRGGAAQIGLADWLMQKLDTPPQNPQPQEYQVAGHRGPELVHVFYFANAQTQRDMMEIATATRSIADIQWVFVCNESKAMATRGPADRMALAAWLAQKLDQAPAGVSGESAKHEYLLPSGSDNVVRLFYFNPPQTSEQLEQIMKQIQSTLHMGRVFINNSLSAVAARGTLGQISSAERLLEEVGKSTR